MNNFRLEGYESLIDDDKKIVEEYFGKVAE